MGNQPQNIVLYNEAIKIKAEALLKSAEATAKSAEAKQEQIRMEKWQPYIKLEEKDTFNFSGEKLRRHEAMLNQLPNELAEE